MIVSGSGARVTPEWLAAVQAERDAAARQLRKAEGAHARASRRIAALGALLAEVDRGRDA